MYFESINPNRGGIICTYKMLQFSEYCFLLLFTDSLYNNIRLLSFYVPSIHYLARTCWWLVFVIANFTTDPPHLTRMP